jgi:aquaporin Z
LPSIGRAAFAESLGTLGLVFIGAGAVMSAGVGLDATGIALASGLAVAAMTTATLASSGGHLNPAITIGALLTKRVDALTATVYIVVQLLGAAVGAVLLRALLPGVVYDAAAGGAPALAPGYAVAKAIGVEAIVTFLLVITYLVAVGSGNERWQQAPGLAVGLLLAAGTLAFAPYTGAAFNPARWFGTGFASGRWGNWVVWAAGPMLGGVAGGLAYLGIGARRERASSGE